MLCRVSPFGNLRIYAYLQLPAAYRSLSRPSSAPDAKAFSMCSCSLDLLSRAKRLLVLLAINYVSKLIGICCSSYPRISYIRAFFLKKPDFFLTLLFIQFSNINTTNKFVVEHIKCSGGGKEIRTPDPLLARQVLSQLSYTPM